MPLADDLVKFIIFLWFSFAFIAGLALIFDQLQFILFPKSRTILHFLRTQIPEEIYINITYDTYSNISSVRSFWSVLYILSFFTICSKLNNFHLYCTFLTILVQTRFLELFLPYNTYFNTEHKLVHYLFPLIKDYISNC